MNLFQDISAHLRTDDYILMRKSALSDTEDGRRKTEDDLSLTRKRGVESRTER